MTFSAAQAEAAVIACTEPSQQPTKQQVLELARMTHSGDTSLEKIQEILFKRLVEPGAYQWREVEHTLVVIQQCSFVGSLGFVTFFKDRVYAIAALANYQDKNSPNPDNATRVQWRAQVLSQLLQDGERLQKERRKAIISNPSGPFGNVRWRPNDPQAPRGRTAASWRAGVTPSSASSSPSTSLPTPETSPVRGRSPVGEDNGDGDDGDSDDLGTDTSTLAEITREEEVEAAVHTATSPWSSPSDVARDEMDEIVDMTFNRDNLAVVVGVLVEKLLPCEDKGNYRDIVKALTIINHCLLHGSEEFAGWFRDNREMIVPLCAYPVPAVTRLAMFVLKRLDADGAREAMPKTQRPSPTYHPASTSPRRSSSADSESIPMHEPVKDLTAFITTLGQHPIASGGYSFVYQATLTLGSMTELVAKKVLTSRQISRGRLEKRLNREVHTWTQLSHPNIADFYGITRETNGSVGLVSPFFSQGNIVDYLNSLDRSHVDVLKIMNDIVSGVGYLHAKDIVHGDIKASNIMVDDMGRAKLIDFGVSRITGENGYTTSGSGISWAWAAPELLLGHDEEPISKTPSSDVYAVAITFVEERRAPYRSMSSYAILSQVRQGGVPERPRRDQECNFFPEDRLWTLMLCCWARIPRDRPTISTLGDELRVLSDTGES